MRRFVSLSAVITAVLLVSLIGAMPIHAASPQDSDALSGLNEVKVSFDMQTGNSAALLKQLEVIEETRDSLIKQGVKPSFVITFRSPATKLVQTDPGEIAIDDRENARTIAGKIRALKKAEGIASIEQCAVAIRLAGTKQENVLPEIKVVGNGWISLMAYQAKGYGYIAP
jgi:intracellular sulfur oxidation DsrE/DsrF family protein